MESEGTQGRRWMQEMVRTCLAFQATQQQKLTHTHVRSAEQDTEDAQFASKPPQEPTCEEEME